MFSNKGMKMDDERVQSILDYITPDSMKDL